MSFPKVVNGTVGFGYDALPVKPFNTPLARTTSSASVMALKPMTARIGLTFVFETLIGISFVLLEVWICGVRAHSTCASTERLRQIFLSQLDGYGQLGRIVTLGCALSRLRFATLGCALSRLRFATLGCALSRLRFATLGCALSRLRFATLGCALSRLRFATLGCALSRLRFASLGCALSRLRFATLGCALSRLRFATLGCALSRLRFATLGCALSRLRFALWAASLDCVWRFARRARRCFLSASRFSSVSIPSAACIWCMAVDFQCRICRIVVLKWAAISASELSSA